MAHMISGNGSNATPCRSCPLARIPQFRGFSEKQVNFVSKFKVGELNVDRGAQILVEGAHSPHLFTVLRGWAFRYKTLPDGRRQVLNYSLPGDLLGLQNSLDHEMQHSAEALSSITLCVFEKERIDEIFQHHPRLAFDITWLAAREERMLDEHLLSVGRRTALERASYLLAFLTRRAIDTRQLSTENLILPLTQAHVADTLGLSTVHTNKTLRKLADSNLIKWRDGGCEIRDLDGLKELAVWESEAVEERPFI